MPIPLLSTAKPQTRQDQAAPCGEAPAGLARLRRELAHHALLLSITLTYCIAAVFYLSNRGLVGLPLFTEYLVAALVPIAALAAFRMFGETFYHAVHVRPFQWGGLWRGIRRSEIFSPERAAAALVPVLLLPLFSSVFTSFKVAIPHIAPFSWDLALMRFDMALHGGMHPWELLQPLLGHPLLTSAVSYLYNLWMGMLLVVYWQMFRLKERELRMQFLLSFVIIWIVLGSIGALMFSSAGPCYYGAVVDGPNPYAAQMAYLNASHEQFKVWSVVAQEFLWEIYQNDTAHLGTGISAMPSLHVGVALLLFFLARHYGRRMAWLAGAYLVVILIGSVHLGWHYAVDGYAGLAGAWLAWGVAGWLVRTVVPPAPRSGTSTSREGAV